MYFSQKKISCHISIFFREICVIFFREIFAFFEKIFVKFSLFLFCENFAKQIKAKIFAFFASERNSKMKRNARQKKFFASISLRFSIFPFRWKPYSQRTSVNTKQLFTVRESTLYLSVKESTNFQDGYLKS